jgi:hypothetical protein
LIEPPVVDASFKRVVVVITLGPDRENSAPSRREYDTQNRDDWKRGFGIAAEANARLREILKRTYGSLNELALDWARIVQRLTDKYHAEIGSKLFADPQTLSKFKAGAAVSSGNPIGVDIQAGGDVPGWKQVGSIHTHPWNEWFDGTDAQLGLLQQIYNHVPQHLYVSEPNGRVFSMDTRDAEEHFEILDDRLIPSRFVTPVN